MNDDEQIITDHTEPEPDATAKAEAAAEIDPAEVEARRDAHFRALYRVSGGRFR